MTTAILQALAQFLTLLFGVLAAGVARTRGGMPPVQRAAWAFVAVFFLWRGVPGVLQAAAALWALLSGPGSAPYQAFLEWGPAMNHTRTLVAVATGWTLVALPLLRDHPRWPLWRLNLACLVLAGTGAYAGWQERPISLHHLASLTILGTVELIGLLAALLVGLVFYTLDRYLWIVLCMFAVQVALDVVWYSFTAGFFTDEWYPPQPLRYVYSGAIASAACGLAWYRLVLARRGARVADLFETATGGGLLTPPRPDTWDGSGARP